MTGSMTVNDATTSKITVYFLGESANEYWIQKLWLFARHSYGQRIVIGLGRIFERKCAAGDHCLAGGGARCPCSRQFRRPAHGNRGHGLSRFAAERIGHKAQ